VHVAVHAHLLVTGYLFTAALVGVDPAPHRPGFPARAVVLVAVLAAHGILAKHLYAHPPAGVSGEQAETAAMLMYYGGDLIHLVLIILLCRRWYGSTRPRPGQRPALPRAQPPTIEGTAASTLTPAPIPAEETSHTRTFG
jgi:putative membrane protein